MTPKIDKKSDFFSKKGADLNIQVRTRSAFFFLFFNIDFFDFFGPLLAPFWPRLGPLGSIWAPRGVILEPRVPFWRPFLMIFYVFLICDFGMDFSCFFLKKKENTKNFVAKRENQTQKLQSHFNAKDLSLISNRI